MINFSVRFLAAAAVLAAVPYANASLILIDWSQAASVAAPAGDGKYWNSIGPLNGGSTNDNTSVSNLVSSTNASTAVDVAVTFASGGITSGFGGTGIVGPAGADPFDEGSAIVDGMFSDRVAGVAMITFSDLTANATYDFSAIGGRISNGADGVIGVTTGTGSGGALLNDGTILNFSVQADGTGVIGLTFNEGPLESTPINYSATFNALSEYTISCGPGAKRLRFVWSIAWCSAGSPSFLEGPHIQCRGLIGEVIESGDSR